MANPSAIAPGEPAHGGGSASVSDVLRALRAKWRFVLVPTLVALVGSTVFVNSVSPRYTGEAKLLLQSGDTYFTRPGQERTDASQLIDEQAVASQVQVVMSRDLAREAIKRLGLVGNEEFDPGAKGPGLLRQLAMLVGLTKSSAERPAEERVLDKYYESLLVYPVGKSRIVSIEFRSRDADLAARGANTVAGLYLDLQENAKKEQARSASTWLGTSIEEFRTRLADAEAKVEAFRSRSGLLTGSGTTTLSAQQLSELSAQLAQARTAQSDSQAKAQLVRDMIREGRGFEIPDVANNELIRRLIEQRINLRAQLALEQRTLLSQHPRIKELNAQLADLESQIRGAAERTSRTLENDARIAGGRVQALEAAIEGQKRVVAQANEGEVQLRALEREARVQREQLESYLTRYREAVARDAGNAAPADARVVSRAVVPQVPSFPKKLPTIALLTFAAFLLSAGAILARELLGPGSGPAIVPTSAERPSYARVGVAAVAPAAEAPRPPSGLAQLAEESASSPPREEQPPSSGDAADAEGRYDFGNLVERLRKVTVADRARRITVIGVESGPEATDVGRGLARTLARTDRTVVVEIDPDESVATGRAGLTDLIAGEASFSEVIRRDAGSPLHRITAGTLKNEALTDEPEGLDVVLSALDRTYDWIVCVLVANTNPELLGLVAPRSDAVVIASNLEPANQDLVRAYEDAQGAGAGDVLVAREQASPELDSAAA